MGYSSDVTSTSYAISSSDISSSYPKTAAFDNITSITNFWEPTPISNSAVNTWIGQNFGSGNAKNIKKFKITQVCAGKNLANTSITLYGYATNVILDYSDDGSTWTSTESFSLNYYTQESSILSSTICTLTSDYGAHQYWRIRVTAGAYTWAASEIEMYTLDTGYATITVTDSSGNALSGATVTVGSVSGTTGSDGTVTLSGLTAGSNIVTVSLAGYTTATSTVTITEGTTATATVVLSAGTVLSVQEV